MKKLLLIFMCIFLISFTFAAKPTQIIDSGCEVRFPSIEVVKQNMDVISYLHVINITSGSNTRLTNTTTTCYAHIYNTTNHLLEQNYTGDENNLEFKLVIDKGNFSKVGVLTFYIECQSPDSVCSAAGQVEVTTNGVKLTIEKSIIYIGLFSILIFLFVINLGVIPFLPDTKSRDDDDKILDVNWLGYLKPVLYVVAWFLVISIMFIGSNIAYAYLESTLFAKLLFNIFYTMMVLSLPMIVIWFIWIFYSITQDSKLKKALERGFE